MTPTMLHGYRSHSWDSMYEAQAWRAHGPVLKPCPPPTHAPWAGLGRPSHCGNQSPGLISEGSTRADPPLRRALFRRLVPDAAFRSDRQRAAVGAARQASSASSCFQDVGQIDQGPDAPWGNHAILPDGVESHHPRAPCTVLHRPEGSASIGFRGDQRSPQKRGVCGADVCWEYRQHQGKTAPGQHQVQRAERTRPRASTNPAVSPERESEPEVQAGL